MKEVTIPFSLFDFFAILVPGIVGLFGIYMLFNPTLTLAGHNQAFGSTVLTTINSELVGISIIVLLSYLLGQVLSGMSEIIIGRLYWRIRTRRAPEVYKDEPAEEPAQERVPFWVVKSVIHEKMPNNHALGDTYVATSRMFQSLLLALGLIAIALILGFIRGAAPLGMTLVGLAVVAVLAPTFAASFRRYQRMWEGIVRNAYEAWLMTKDS